MPMGEEVNFVFSANISLKSEKTLYFAYSVCQWGEGYNSPCPPGYATGIWCLEAPPTVPRLCYAYLSCCIIEEFFTQKNYLSIKGPPLTKS